MSRLLREARRITDFVVDFIEFCGIALFWIWIIAVLTAQRARDRFLDKYRGR